MEQIINPQLLRTRKLLLILPLFFLPLITLAFWGFKHSKSNTAQINNHQGINTSLPGAQFDRHAKAQDKMGFYAQAGKDSAKARSNANNAVIRQFGFKQTAISPATASAATVPAYPDPNETRINQKIAAINKQLNTSQVSIPKKYDTPSKPLADRQFEGQVNKLETMMKSMNGSQGNDPEMQQLSKMLEQIQAIQHPELAKSLIKQTTPVTDSAFKALPAIIDGNQKVLQGGIVRLRLNDTIRIKGQLIPKGQLLFGNATITNQRLLLEIKNIRLGNAIIPVDLSVYSLDGLPGINTPEAELAGATGSGANNALQNMQFLSMDQSLSTQAASAGIEAAKGLLGKKVKRVKVKLKEGYPILLKNNKP